VSCFVIITPAHNEEAFIAATAESMVAQTIRPIKWIVVDDASSDRTADIVRSYSARHSFIELVAWKRQPGRHFGNKVIAFNVGLERAKELGYEFIGNLDADMALPPNYFECILSEFGRDPKLGLAGGHVHTRGGETFLRQNCATDSVAGAVQLFRRECFDEIGGYIPMPDGGVDAAAEITARMHGWRTRTFSEYSVFEHRFTGSARHGLLRSRFKEGRRMHSLGYSFLFFSGRCLYRILEPPAIVGSCAALFGFVDSVVRRRPLLVPPEVVQYLRAEQRGKLRGLLRWATLGTPRAAERRAQ
jgi:poly-beta-1,6-N-acetyl-D-glucosamine synthase